MDQDALIAQLRRQLAASETREQEAQSELQEAQSELQDTTLGEFLDALHEHIFCSFTTQTNPALTTKGTITNPAKKRVPRQLLPWEDFLDVQQEILQDIHGLAVDTRVFPNVNFLRQQGKQWAAYPIGNEKSLEHFEKDAVERPVAQMMAHLAAHCPALAKQYALQEVVFENYYNPMSDNAEEPLARMEANQKKMLDTTTPPGKPSASARTPQNLPRSTQLRADQICVYRVGDAEDERRLALVVEYKAPHKLTLPHLRLGLRPMDISADVVNRVTIPNTIGEEQFQYHADLFTAAAVSQTFHYMIEGGLEYAYLTTGEALVFLKIDWTDVTTLYFHLAEPRAEFDAHERSRNCTAVSQVLALTLLALQAPFHDQEEITTADEILQVWEKDLNVILANIPESERKQDPPESACKARTHPMFDRSPYRTRLAVRNASCDLGIKPFDDGGDDGGDSSPGDTPSKPGPKGAGPKPRGAQAGTKRVLSKGSRSGKNTRQYCTQKCIRGLVHFRGRLDENCPNVAEHRQPDRHHHAVNREEVLRLLRDQLNANRDRDVAPLGVQGARGAAFKVTLSAYGYTFIAKGTVPVFVEDLEHEAEIYRRLQHLQGVCVPVFLGAVELAKPYYYDLGVRISYMAFQSYAGKCVDTEADVPRDSIVRELTRSLQAVHAAGVLQSDVRAPNALWNRELGRVFVIDFERARLVQDEYLPLLLPQHAPPNLRKRRHSCDHDQQACVRADLLAHYTREMQRELGAASIICH